MSQTSYIITIKAAIVLTVLTFKLNYAQDSLKKNTSIISFSTSFAINDAIDKGNNIEKANAFSYWINYCRNRDRLEFSYTLGFEQQKLIQENVLASYEVFDKNSNKYSRIYYNIQKVKMYRNFLSFNFGLGYSIFKINNFTTNIRIGTKIGKYIFTKANGEIVEYWKYGLQVDDYIPLTLNLGFNLKYSFHKHFELNALPFYDVCVFKSNQKRRYFNFGAALGIGYKW